MLRETLRRVCNVKKLMRLLRETLRQTALEDVTLKNQTCMLRATLDLSMLYETMRREYHRNNETNMLRNTMRRVCYVKY